MCPREKDWGIFPIKPAGACMIHECHRGERWTAQLQNSNNPPPRCARHPPERGDEGLVPPFRGLREAVGVVSKLILYRWFRLPCNDRGRLPDGVLSAGDWINFRWKRGFGSGLPCPFPGCSCTAGRIPGRSTGAGVRGCCTRRCGCRCCRGRRGRRAA